MFIRRTHNVSSIRYNLIDFYKLIYDSLSIILHYSRKQIFVCEHEIFSFIHHDNFFSNIKFYGNLLLEMKMSSQHFHEIYLLKFTLTMRK